MEIRFRDSKLEKLSKDERKCLRTLGAMRGRLFLSRLLDLSDADSLEDVRYMPGHYHELTADRKGQWACNLDQPYRLIFEPHLKPIPTSPDGKFIWIEIKAVEIVEISNYHGK
ncbi:MAG: type II toxin-antitoxin system RelE/ParE family toxin [Bacteroidaceae bacterium]|nr:type II toxin-antitoxin system RelE/ParE family toxin [Bacteroidaceae bacterium]